MVKRADLEPEIRRLWLERPTDRRRALDVLTFFGELQQKHPYLLSFRTSGDPYQVLKSILHGLTTE